MSYLCNSCIVFDLYKILTLTSVNKFPFVSLNRIFTRTFDKLGCISTIKINGFRIAILIFAILVLSSICTNF